MIRSSRWWSATSRTRYGAAFALLPDRDRELLELRVVAGLSSDEVASILDMQPGAVRTAQARALDKLRAVLARSEEVGA